MINLFHLSICWILVNTWLFSMESMFLHINIPRKNDDQYGKSRTLKHDKIWWPKREEKIQLPSVQCAPFAHNFSGALMYSQSLSDCLINRLSVCKPLLNNWVHATLINHSIANNIQNALSDDHKSKNCCGQLNQFSVDAHFLPVSPFKSLFICVG